jgi:hypothetical protein
MNHNKRTTNRVWAVSLEIPISRRREGIPLILCYSLSINYEVLTDEEMDEKILLKGQWKPPI